MGKILKAKEACKEDLYLGLNKKDGKMIRKNHIKEIMNKEKDRDNITEASMIEVPMEKVTRKEMAIAIKAMKPGKAAEPSEVYTKIISASEEVGTSIMMELYQRVMDGKGMSDKWETIVVVPIFKGKGNVRNCYTYQGVKLLEYPMKVVERVLERRIRELVNIDAMQFDFIPGRGTIDALFVARRMQEK